MKILIIGLDGATWDVLDEFLIENHMPNLRKLKSEGCSGTLQSTEPPTTSTAWTTLLTGCNPSKHGITGIQKYSFDKNSLSILNSTDCLVPNLWQELSSQGYRVVSINVPWTYPCPQVNGIVVAGFGCPGPDGQFTFPQSFRDELLAAIPDYDILARFDRPSNDSLEEFDKNIQRVERSFEQKLQAARLAGKKIDWDIMMVQFHDIDKIQHQFWAYVGSNSRDKYARQRNRLFETFEKLDETIGQLLDCSPGKELLVVVVSDHGGGRLTGVIRPNVLLHKWGYLKHKLILNRMMNREYRRWKRRFRSILFGPKKIECAKTRQPKGFNVNWKHSKAVVLHTATNGYLYIGLGERQQGAPISSPPEHDGVIQELKKRFSEVPDPVTNQPLFSRVVTPTELYGANNITAGLAGNLILIPQPGYDIRTSTSRGKDYLSLTQADSTAGTHRYEGIYVFSGSTVKTGNNKRAEIVDIAPTIYAALGAKLPPYLDGRVLNEVFKENLELEYAKSKAGASPKAPKQQELSSAEQTAISERLAELGYL